MRGTARAEVAVRVREALSERGWPQARLAAAVSLSAASLSRKLAGSAPLYVPELLRIAAALDVDPGRFVEGVRA